MIRQFKATVAAAGTRVALKSSRVMCTWAIIQADSGNTNNIYVGDVTVNSTNGFPLPPSTTTFRSIIEMRPIDINYIDLSAIYIDADTNSNSVHVVYGVR